MVDLDKYNAGFYNLGGSNYLEHIRNFHKYFNDLKTSKVDTLTLIRQLKPRNLQEDIFHVKLQLEFGSDEELVKTFLKCNVILNKILVESKKFIYIFIKKHDHYFTDQVFENISYGSKAKLIHKLSYAIQDVIIGENYFNVIHAKYGLKMATPLLLACGESLIKHIFKETDVQLNDRQLIYLHKKHPDCVRVYFANYKNFNNHSTLAQYLCFHDLELFRSLLEYGTPKIGRQAFDNFVKKYKNDIIEEPAKFKLPLRHDLVYKNSSINEFKVYFTNLLEYKFASKSPKPKFRHNSMYNEHSNFQFKLYLDSLAEGNFTFHKGIIKCITLVPPKLRGELFFTSFKEKFGFNIYSQTEEIPVEVLELLPLQDRLKFDLGDEHIEMQDSTISIPKLKAKISITQASAERITLLKKLVITCKVNNDLNGLLDVLKYVYYRHRNENHLNREAFLCCVMSNFNLEKLSGAHWEYLRNLLMIFHINDESFYRSTEYWKKMIIFKIENNLDYSDDLKYYFASRNGYWSNMLWKYPKHEKNCLLQVPNYISNTLKKEDRIREAKISFLKAITAYNSRNPKDRISYYNYPDYLDLLCSELQINYCYCTTVLKYFIRQKIEDVNLYEKVLNHSTNYYFISDFKSAIWLLQRKPQLFATYYCHKFFNTKKCKHLKHIFYQISKMHYLDVYEKFKNYALEILQNQDDGVKIKNALSFLSFIRDFDYIKAIETYLPKMDCKMDLQNENFKRSLDIQKGIMEQLKNFQLPLKNIQTVLQLCNGDYLQFALKPLYYTLYSIPEKHLNEYYTILLTKNVSVRKHTIFLISQLGNTKDVTKLLKLAMDKENNPSAKKAIVTTTLQKFRQDQSNDYWVLFKRYLEIIQENDLEIIDHLLEFKVPRRHTGDFIKLIWERLKLYGKKMEYKVLQKISIETFNALPDDFCDELIKSLHLIDTNLYTIEFSKLITNYLIFSNEKLNHRVSFLYECIAKQNVYKACQTLNQLCIALCTSDDKQALGVITKLEENFNAPFNSLHFKLLFAITKSVLEFKRNKKNFNDELAKFVQQQFTQVINLQRGGFSSFYANFILRFLHLYFKSSVEKHEIQISMLQLVEAVLKLDHSEDAILLCLKLLPQTTFKNEGWKEKHEGLIQKIKFNSTEIIDVYLFEYLCTVDIK